MSEYKNPDYSPPRSEDEPIQRYQKGERYFGETELDKETIDFREACLEDIIFTPRSFLTADFRNAKLMGADFSDCNLKTCDFRGADLRNARFNGAAIDATQFTGANFHGADFSGATCYGIVLDRGEYQYPTPDPVNMVVRTKEGGGLECTYGPEPLRSSPGPGAGSGWPSPALLRPAAVGSP